ncbi:hypothetical protein GpartN1_g661.t1 [Galdieria partita]|uniref:4-hydroxybenzoate polyprenyltransferase, mitochondrial n=1 Tax=Galdieria partita TaxID=83374 RepID=A0A9C7PQW9_9RHOD|nr:hypothetical protein GpartN1_g661.t1 [Galdieria partita]
MQVLRRTIWTTLKQSGRLDALSQLQNEIPMRVSKNLTSFPDILFLPALSRRFTNHSSCKKQWTSLVKDFSLPNLRENPYVKLARLDKPIGTWLLYLPGAWSISLASEAGHVSDFWLLSLFGIGAILLRGAGCTINDLWDSRLDRLVERSKSRPLASGEVTKKQALFFVSAQLLGGLPILLSLNMYSQLLGASSLCLVTLYPLAKRVTFWPQLVLGLTFNWGALLGWVAVKGSLDLPALFLYGAGVAWTLIYDTIYAHQDKLDDKRIGIRSTALYFGDRTDRWLFFFSGIHSSLLLLAGYSAEQTAPYYTSVIIGSFHLWRQIFRTNYDDPEECAKTFRSNRNYGLIILLGICAGNFVRTKRHE